MPSNVLQSSFQTNNFFLQRLAFTHTFPQYIFHPFDTSQTTSLFKLFLQFFFLLLLSFSFCLTHSPRWKMIKHLSKVEIEADILMETYKAKTFFKIFFSLSFLDCLYSLSLLLMSSRHSEIMKWKMSSWRRKKNKKRI